MIDFDALCHAYETGSWSRRFYFDVAGGTVILVTETQRAELQDIYDEFGEYSADVPPHLAHAHAVELDDDRYRKIPVCPPRTLNALRETFSQTVDPLLQPLLWRALDANDGAWFERILGMESAELTRWRQFKRAAHQTTLTNHLKLMHS